MSSSPHNPSRRQLLAAMALVDIRNFFDSLQPKPDSYREWFDAIRLDDAGRLQSLLARGFDPNSVEPERFDTGLIVAVRLKSANVFALLLDHPQTNLDARSLNGDTALMIAAYQSDTAAALALIDKGAEINRPGWTALHYAAASGNVTILRRLLDASAFIDAESPNKTTPLMMAARSGHDTLARLLLDEGADASLQNEAGLTAAAFAHAQGFLALAQELEAAIRPRPAPPSPAD